MSSTDYENEPLDQLIYNGNTSWLIKTEGGTYFAPPTYQGTTAGLLPACFQGRRAAVVNKLKGDKSQSDMVTLPQSTADDNVNQVTVNASIDGMAMDIERTESLTGAMKESIATIMTDEQEFDAYDQYLGRKKPYMERIAGGAKKGTTQKFAKEREEQQDDFKEEIKAYHDQAAASVISSGRTISRKKSRPIMIRPLPASSVARYWAPASTPVSPHSTIRPVTRWTAG